MAEIQRALNRGGFGGNLQVAATGTTTAGSTLMVIATVSQNENVTSITDSAGNTYVQASPSFTATWWKPSIWICVNAASVAATTGWFQLNIANSRDRGLVAYEIPVADVGAAPTVSTSGSQNQSSGTTTFATCTTTGSALAGDLVYTAIGTAPGVTLGVASWSIILQEAGGSTNPGMGVAKIASATAGAQSATWTTDANRDGAVVIVALTPSGGGGGDPEGRLIGGKLIRGGLLRGGVL